jgi:hypothetical protein
MSDLTSPTGRGPRYSAADASLNPRETLRVARGSPAPTHRVRVEPSCSMRAVSGEVEALLDGLDEGSRIRAALLASELIAQVTGRAPERGPVGLTIEPREDAVRLEATGSVTPSVQGTADHHTASGDPFADWGRFILDREADRWGVGGGERPTIWAEIEVAA